jgi:hypothetical protein
MAYIKIYGMSTLAIRQSLVLILTLNHLQALQQHTLTPGSGQEPNS